MSLRADALALAYPPVGRQEGRRVLSEVSLELEPGRFEALAGPNGAGKSTLLKALAGLLSPESGKVRLDGEELGALPLAERARHLGYLPQEVAPHFRFSVAQSVLLGARVRGGGSWLQDGPTPAQEATIERVLGLVDALHLRERPLSALSGGERRRVLLASVLAQEPRYLLLDEPAAMLDLSHQAELFRLFRRLAHEEGLGVLCVSHDWNLAASFADRLTILHDGGVHARGAPAELMTDAVLAPLFGGSYLLVPREGEVPVLLPR